MNDNRATKIAIGTVVIAILTWWLITGTVSRAVSIPFEQGDNRLSSVGSFGIELLADVAYLVGVITTSVLSGLWTLLKALVGKLINTSTATTTEPPVDLQTLKAGLLQVRNPIREELAKIQERLAALESAKPEATKPKAATKTRRTALRTKQNGAKNDPD